jgi:hypothetical protein
VATITKPTVPLLTVPEPSQPSVHPPCVACKEAEPGITTHCGLPICHGCIEGGKQHALFQVVGNEVRCYYCHKPIDPSVYVGKVETAILEPVMKTVGFLKEKQSSSAMSEEASAWNLSVLCPNADCRQPLPGLEGGCDIIQCTKCGVQLNLATGEMKKSGLAHTFTVGKFLQFISGFDARQGNYVIKRCQTEFAGLWKRFKFDVLLHRLEGASTRQEREALIATLVAPEVQSLKAFFAIQYLR